MADHLNEFQGNINQLAAMGMKFDDEVLGLWLLSTLPDSWETFRFSLANSTPNGVISFEVAKRGVLNEEIRRKTQGSSPQYEFLVTENRGRSKQKAQEGRDKSRSKSRSRYKNVECYYCGKMDHIQKNCFKWKKENKGDGAKQEDKIEKRQTGLLLLPLMISRLSLKQCPSTDEENENMKKVPCKYYFMENLKL